MKRRNTLKSIGGIGLASVLGIGASGTASTSDRNGAENNNPGRVASYNGDRTLVPPDLGGFDHVILYLAEGDPNPDWDRQEEAMWFQKEIMGRSTEEVVANRNAAVEFFAERFGLHFPDADEDDVFETVDSTSGIDATLRPFAKDPNDGYTAYVVSGRAMPNNHGGDTTNLDPESTGKVRDGGWIAEIEGDAEFGGSYGAGGESGFEAGTIVLFGNYNIRMGDREPPIVLDYESEHPVPPAGRVPRAFNCDLRHEEWGEGQVHGVSGGTMSPTGIRNVITFPPSLG